MSQLNLSFPAFKGFTRTTIYACMGVYVALVVLGVVSPYAEATVRTVLALSPALVVHGMVWQLATYALVHNGVTHILFNMLSLWFIGSYLEVTIGTRKVAELFWVSVVGGALCTVAFSYTHLLGASPLTQTEGASAGILGMLIAFAVLFGDHEFLLFPLPFRMKAKWLVTIYVLVDLFSLLDRGPGDHTAYIAHLGGALFGWIYLKRAPRRGYMASTSERYYAVRNDYYRWKRKRAQRKFEVYMRKHKDN